MTDPLTPLERVEELFKGAAEKAGAKVVHFSVAPSRREVIVVLDLADELFLDEETREVRDAFDDLMKNATVQRKEDEAVDSVRGLADLEQKLREDPDGGIL